MAQTEASKDERGTKLRAAYQEATTAVRDENRDRFEELYEAAAKKRGIEYKRKPKPEEQAAEQIAALFAQFPDLREEFVGGLPETPPE